MSAEQQHSTEANAEGIHQIALKDLFRLLKKEVESTSLQAFEPDTFKKIAATLGNLKGQGYEGIEAKVRDRMTDLFASSAQLLIETRQHKMLAGSEPLDYSKLADEEKYILDGMRESGVRRNEVVTATVKGRIKVLESISAKVRSKQIVVRFLRPMEQFVGVDMARYGPFQQEDVASLPFENARSMIDTGVVVQVHVQPYSL
jgi:DNA replication factor GINS